MTTLSVLSILLLIVLVRPAEIITFFMRDSVFCMNVDVKAVQSVTKVTIFVITVLIIILCISDLAFYLSVMTPCVRFVGLMPTCVRPV